MRQPFIPEPPTVADLAEHGSSACLAALREEFDELHKRWDQYRGWTEGTTLGVVTCRFGGDGTFVRAEPGDLVLVKRDPYRALIGCRPRDSAYMPRVAFNVSIAFGGVADVPIEDAAAR